MRYLEVRPVNGNFAQTNEMNGFRPAEMCYPHVLDLRRDLPKCSEALTKITSSVAFTEQSALGSAEECGSSDDLLKDFYGLFAMTRHRHQLPPTRYTWFQNLIEFQGKALEIRLAYKADTPISATLTLRCKDAVYYKYGCSDIQFNRFGAIPWLLWRAIAAAKLSGATEFDLGRTDEDDTGLLVFKNHWV